MRIVGKVEFEIVVFRIIQFSKQNGQRFRVRGVVIESRSSRETRIRRKQAKERKSGTLKDPPHDFVILIEAAHLAYLGTTRRLCKQGQMLRRVLLENIILANACILVAGHQRAREIPSLISRFIVTC